MLAMLSLKKLSQDEMIRLFGLATFNRGKDYIGHVLELEAEEDRIHAVVLGSAPDPYELDVYARTGRMGRAGIQSRCSCPMGGHCKHVVAALLAAQRVQGKPIEMSRTPLQEWIAELRNTAQAPNETVAHGKPSLRIYYRLAYDTLRAQWQVRLYKALPPADGEVIRLDHEWRSLDRALVRRPQFVSEDELPLLRMLHFYARSPVGGDGYMLEGETGAQLMRPLLATQRLVLDGRLLHLAAPRTGDVQWRVNEQERLYPRLVAEPAATHLLPLQPPWYVDVHNCEAGEVALALSLPVLQQLLKIPPLARNEVTRAAAALAELAPQLPAPSRATLDAVRQVGGKPVAVLRFDTINDPAYDVLPYYLRATRAREWDVAQPRLMYEDVSVPLRHAGNLVTLPDGEVVKVKRHAATENKLRQALELLPAKVNRSGYGNLALPRDALTLEFLERWDEFRDEVMPQLQKAGWQIEYAPGFRYRELEVEDWQAEISDSGDGWFNLDMGIVVEGRRQPLAPMLAALFRHDARWLDGVQMQRIADRERITLLTDDGQVVRVSAARLKPIAATLIDLFSAGFQPDILRVHRYDAPRLEVLGADTSRWQFKGAQAVQAMAARLQAAGAVQPVAAPAGFCGTLRDYQQQGLAWLQYLRANELSGILADDMGLGKTAQAIAHLLAEKEQGRMDRPSLVVLPTSLVFNWKSELARFAPGLSVLVLHGAERKEQFDAIARHDIVLTTYPLLWRDAEALLPFEYHYLLLDEAQYVKNAGSKSAVALRQLRARHRLCLTGTPMENHLGELWAQFDFLMPGFLEDSKRFAKTWRTPIEKNGDSARMLLLNQRVRPFILRRRKEDVAKELPPKTTIVRAVELQGAQRDLYETVRSAMDSKVRAEIADKGLNRSQIVILDALLKLRQVCCDPRLLKSVRIGKKMPSAKLELLREMLPEMVAEGRRILLFSQFTEMLALIEAELEQAAIPFVKLTGQTRDRATPVKQFQQGDVPVFLISLKAGGVGLNLTTADTVIHYDPWWNPAVENQATDRAHRIGQQNSVFVYKLTVAGSIEEKMLALQERKAQLAAGMLGRDEHAELKFGEAEIAALLAPLPEN
ncbi:hypothetical protein UT5_04350 [Ferrigenium sp. UT5]